MAEIAGAIIGGMGICNQLFQLGREIQKAVKTIKNSRRDIEELANETIIFADLYQKFSSVCNESDDNASSSVAIAELNAWARSCIHGLEDLLDKVDVLLCEDKSSHFLEERLIAHLQWLFSKSTVKALRASLSVARESINGIGTLMHLNKLDAWIKKLKEYLKDRELRRDLEKKLRVPLEEAIGECEENREHWQITHKENNKTLQAAIARVHVYQKEKKTADIVPAPEQILRFTNTLEDILASREPISQSKNSASVPTASMEPSTVPPMTRRTSAASHTSSIRVFATLPSSSSSSNPISSSLYYTEVSSSTSGASTRESIAPPGPSRQSASTAQGADTAIERLRTNRGEYMNDPDGTILSPPIMKSHPANSSSTRREQVGRHTVLLSVTTFQVNANKLKIMDYAAADAFFKDIIRRENKLDELDKRLSDGCQERWTHRTSDWLFETGGITLRGYRLS